MFELELSGADPVENFRRWFREAHQAGVRYPEQVCLSTASRDGAPSARMVLLRGIEEGRFQFFTDYRSRKARELDGNPRAAMVFYWDAANRQVRVEGTVARLAPGASDRYFLSRQRGSRLSAWASCQSAAVDDRDVLLQRRAEIERRFVDREVTRPEHWGGYGLLPHRIEFWQSGEHRLHDRLVFRREGRAWTRQRLQP